MPLYRFHATPEQIRHFLLRHLLDAEHHQGLPLHLRKLLEFSGNRILKLSCGNLAGRRHGLRVADNPGTLAAFLLSLSVQRRHPSQGPGPAAIQGQIAGDSQQPGAEQAGVGKTAKFFKRVKESLLHDFQGILSAIQEAKSQRRGAALISRDKNLKGSAVAIADGSNELPIVAMIATGLAACICGHSRNPKVRRGKSFHQQKGGPLTISRGGT